MFSMALRQRQAAVTDDVGTGLSDDETFCCFTWQAMFHKLANVANIILYSDSRGLIIAHRCYKGPGKSEYNEQGCYYGQSEQVYWV